MQNEQHSICCVAHSSNVPRKKNNYPTHRRKYREKKTYKPRHTHTHIWTANQNDLWDIFGSKGENSGHVQQFVWKIVSVWAYVSLTLSLSLSPQFGARVCVCVFSRKFAKIYGFLFAACWFILPTYIFGCIRKTTEKYQKLMIMETVIWLASFVHYFLICQTYKRRQDFWLCFSLCVCVVYVRANASSRAYAWLKWMFGH